MGRVYFTGGRASRTQRRKLPAQKPSKWRWGNIGGIPKSTERSSGGRKAHSQTPRSAQHEAAEQDGEMHRAEHIAYLRQMAVTMGSTKASARKSAASTTSRAGEEFWFSSVSSCDCAAKNTEKGACQSACKPTADHGVCFKNAAAENSVRRASARRPGFLPEIVKIIAECRRICQDSPGQAAN